MMRAPVGIILGLLVVMTSPVQASDKNGVAPAQENCADSPYMEDIELLELEVEEVLMVYTAGRRPQKISQLPYAVTVLTAEDIHRSGARNVPEVLRLVPGMDVAAMSYVNYAVSPRGVGGLLSRSSLILVDGRQIYDSLYGGTLWGNWPIQIENIERIEVIRGPGGVTWGANALNGVINVITKDPAQQQGLTLTAMAGSRGMQREYVGYGFVDDKLRMRVSGEYEGSDGFSLGGFPIYPLDDGAQSGKMTLHGVYEISPRDQWTFSAGSAVIHDGFQISPVVGPQAFDNANSQAEYIMSKWSRQIEKDNRLELIGYLNDFHNRSGSKIIDLRYQQLALQLNHSFKANEKHNLTWGIDTRTDLLDTGNADPYLTDEGFHSTAVIGLYLEDAWNFAEHWTLTLGGRIDYEFYKGFLPSGRISLAYAPDVNNLFYAAVSRAYQVNPLLGHLELPALGGLAHATANRDMQEETLIAYELGWRGLFYDRWKTNLNLYCHQYDNLSAMHQKIGPPGLVQLYFDNDADTYSIGFEASTEFDITDRWSCNANYTFQYWAIDDNFFIKRDALVPPDHKFTVGTLYSPTDDLHLSSQLFFVDSSQGPHPLNPFGSTDIGSYFRLDLRGEYEFWDDRGCVAVGVRNLLDPHHREGTSTFQNPAEVPRMIYAEIRMVFK